MGRGTLIRSHLPCPDCGSSDALATYTDHTYCYSCMQHKNISLDTERKSVYNSLNKSNYDLITTKVDHYLSSIIDNENIREPKLNLITTTSQQYVQLRGLSVETLKHYGVVTAVDPEGKPLSITLPYGSDGAKHRRLDRKEFWTTGEFHNAQPLFGMDRFSASQSRSITVTEGELDALSAYQMLGSKYPAVSIRSSSSGRRDCERARDFLNSFEKIYLCFDNDEPGQRATREVSQLFDVNKVYHVKLDKFKDANDYLQNGAEKDFVSLWWAAKPVIPKGILTSYEDIKRALEATNTPTLAEYPFPSLQKATYGIRGGELNLITAQEGIGKTEFIRAIEYHLLRTTDDNIGVIHLEEGEKRSVQGLAGYHLECPAHLPDSDVSNEDVLNAIQALTKREGRLYVYSHFGSDDPNTIIDIIRYLVGVCHCKFIFLDHITMLVTGFEDEDERKKLDYLSTKFAQLAHDLDFAFFLVSHINDDGKTRGSRNISKVAHLHVSLDRPIKADDPSLKNKMRIMIEKNRFGASTGSCGWLTFNPETFKLAEDTEISWNPESF